MGKKSDVMNPKTVLGCQAAFQVMSTCPQLILVLRIQPKGQITKQVMYSFEVNTRFVGSAVAQCLTRDRGAAGSSLTGVTVLCSFKRHIYPSLVLVQPRKTRPCLPEILLMGRKESN